jgi:hypothetical protein
MNWNKMHSFLFKIIHLCLMVPLLIYGQNKVGTSAAPFLGIPIGPRAHAMGGAYIAAVNDVTAAFWNPGALSRINGTEVTVSHANWLLGTDLNWIGLNVNMSTFGTLAFSITQLDYGKEEETTVTEPEGTGRYWDAQDMAFALSYARNFTDRFSLGGSVKYIHQAIANETASTMAVDLGLLYFTGMKGLRLAMSISNYGGKMRMDGKDLLVKYDIDPDNTGHNETLVARKKTEDWPLPIFFRVGAAMDVVQISENRLTIAVDALHPTDNVESVNLGAEYSWRETVALRGGYKSLFLEESIEGLTLGAGLQYAIPNLGKFRIDYSYADFSILGDVQTFALTVIF